MGFPLPGDFRSLIDMYGEGCFDHFLWLLHPTSENPNLNLVMQLRFQRESLAGVDMPNGFSPEDLVPWAGTDNGDVCYWRLDSGPKRMPGRLVVVNEARGPAWKEYNKSATEWLLAVLTRRLRVPVFPIDFPSEKPSFNAYLRPDRDIEGGFPSSD